MSMMALIPDKLKPGDKMKIVSPATSLALIPEDQRETVEERLTGLGLRITYSENGDILDQFDSAPVETRVSDLHEAFRDRTSGVCSPPWAATTATGCRDGWTTA
jgi:muramoyltetrapeptide carboxypeptidase LdcA involved in peptidoglycan recycling